MGTEVISISILIDSHSHSHAHLYIPCADDGKEPAAVMLTAARCQVAPRNSRIVRCYADINASASHMPNKVTSKNVNVQHGRCAAEAVQNKRLMLVYFLDHPFCERSILCFAHVSFLFFSQLTFSDVCKPILSKLFHILWLYSKKKRCYADFLKVPLTKMRGENPKFRPISRLIATYYTPSLVM